MQGLWIEKYVSSQSCSLFVFYVFVVFFFLVRLQSLFSSLYLERLVRFVVDLWNTKKVSMSLLIWEAQNTSSSVSSSFNTQFIQYNKVYKIEWSIFPVILHTLAILMLKIGFPKLLDLILIRLNVSLECLTICFILSLQSHTILLLYSPCFLRLVMFLQDFQRFLSTEQQVCVCVSVFFLGVFFFTLDQVCMFIKNEKLAHERINNIS